MNGIERTNQMTHEQEITLKNLLEDCGGIKRGTKLLLVNEPNSVAVCRTTVEKIADYAIGLGADVENVWIAPVDGPEDIPAFLIEKISASEVTIFNHGMGAMLRLRPGVGSRTTILNYITNEKLLSSDWGRVPYAAWEQINAQVGARLDSAKRWKISCPWGTHLEGTFPPVHQNNSPATSSGFSLLTFPVGTHRPMGAEQVNGKLAVKWLASSANHDVGAGLCLDAHVLAVINDSRIVSFDGPKLQACQAMAYLEKIGEKNSKDPFLINSWHAGTNPLTCVPWKATEHLNEWQLLSHNSPRLLHFHVVGEQAPGEISIPILDPVVTIDDATFWDKGKMTMLNMLPVQSWLGEKYRYATDHIATDSTIGVDS